MVDKCLKIAFVGAGSVNFGGAEGPWDHASRVEKMPHVSVQAIIDPLIDRARDVLTKRKQGQYASVYQDCQIYASFEDFWAVEKEVDVALIGTPNFTRGCKESGQELKFLEAGIHCFIEKPISATPPEEFNTYVKMLEDAAEKNNLIVSVGYMFREYQFVFS